MEKDALILTLALDRDTGHLTISGNSTTPNDVRDMYKAVTFVQGILFDMLTKDNASANAEPGDPVPAKKVVKKPQEKP